MTVKSTHHVSPDILYRSTRTIEKEEDFQKKKQSDDVKTDNDTSKKTDQK